MAYPDEAKRLHGAGITGVSPCHGVAYSGREFVHGDTQASGVRVSVIGVEPRQRRGDPRCRRRICIATTTSSPYATTLGRSIEQVNRVAKGMIGNQFTCDELTTEKPFSRRRGAVLGAPDHLCRCDRRVAISGLRNQCPFGRPARRRSRPGEWAVCGLGPCFKAPVVSGAREPRGPRRHRPGFLRRGLAALSPILWPRRRTRRPVGVAVL